MTHPDIQKLLTPPDNWQFDYFENQRGQKIRYGFNAPDNAKALVIIAEGRTECIEEYFETIRDFNAQGYACAIMDWQGQGRSYRYMDDNSRHHSIGFEYDISDFGQFLAVLNIDLPRVLFAHSMGANITLRYMAERPTIFKCAYLSAPMLGLKPKRLIRYTARVVLDLADRLNAMEKYALGQSKWNLAFANIAKHKVSSDSLRRDLQPYLFQNDPELHCGGVTFGWLKEALVSIAFLHDKDTCARITPPTFMAMAGRDVVVDNDGAMMTASLLPHCETHVFEESEHQIHRERDEIRSGCMTQFYNFVEKHLSS